MISIFKHLYSSNGNSRGGPKAASAEDMSRFSLGILDSIQKYVLIGEGCDARRRRLAQVAEALQAGFSPEQALQMEGTIAGILAEHHAVGHQAAVAQAIEIQHIFAMLNQALIVLAEGRDRSVSRLNDIQESLQRTSMIRDIVALKSALAETVKFVQEESRQAHEAVSEELGRFETEVSKVRDFIGNTRIEMAGRTEGMAKIAETAAGLVPGQSVYVVAYLCDRLHAVTQRYGAPVAEELVFRLIKERLQPVAPVSGTYRWTPSSLVGVFARRRDLSALQIEVANLNRAPVMHRIALGNRTAVLTISPSTLVGEAVPESPDVLIGQLDRFTGAHP